MQFQITDLPVFKSQLMVWASQFNTCFWLDSNEYSADAYTQYELLVGIGLQKKAITTA